MSARMAVRAGWPGEQILGGAAKNRLNVLLARLRSMGLRDVVVTHENGYMLDPSLPLRVVSDVDERRATA